MTDFSPELDDFEDEWSDEEPIASCENCDANIYADDLSERFCDACLWAMKQTKPKRVRKKKKTAAP